MGGNIIMSKRIRGPKAQIRHVGDLKGAVLPRTSYPVSVSVRFSGWYLQLWRQICKALPGQAPADVIRRSLLLAGATLFKNDEGERPDVFLRNPHDGSETRLDVYLGLGGRGLIEQAMKPVRLSLSDLRGAAKQCEENYAITLRVSGFYRQLYDQIVNELDGLNPSDVIRRCLLVLAVTLFEDSDGSKPEVYIRNPGAPAERLEVFLGLDAP